MSKLIACLVMLALGALVVAAEEQQTSDDKALRERIEARYDVVPIADGIALTPKQRNPDVRLIEISDVISINGTTVTGRELRDRVGDDADDILKLSYLDRDARRALFATSAPAESPQAEASSESARRSSRRMDRSHGDRVRIFGDVTVREGEDVTGQVVAVLGSVRINGEVGSDVVSVLGSVDLGEKAVVGGDVVSVGGRVNRTPGAQVRGGVTEVSLSDFDHRLHGVPPWLGGLGALSLFGGLGAVPRLIGTTFRALLLLLFA